MSSYGWDSTLDKPNADLPAFGQDSIKAYNDLISSRLDKIHWWRDDPVTAAWLTGTTLEERHVRAMSNHLPTVQAWVNQATSVGGAPAVLRSAYTKALTIADPKTRLEAVSTLNSIRALPPAEAQAFLTLLHGQTLGTGPTTPAPLGMRGGAPQGPVNTPASSAATALQSVTGAVGGGGVTFDAQGVAHLPEESSTDSVASLEYLFPSLKGKLNFSDGGITLQDVKDSYFDSSFPQLNRFRQDVYNQKPGEGVASLLSKGQTLKDIGIGAADLAPAIVAATATAGAALPAAAGGAAAGWAATAALPIVGLQTAAELPQFHSSNPAVDKYEAWAHMSGAPVRLVFHAMSEAGQKIGATILPGSDADVQGILGGTILAIGLAGVAKGGAAVMSESSIPTASGAAEGAEGYTGAPEVAGPIESVKAQLEAQSTMRTLTHLPQTFLNPVIDSLARQAAEGTGLADLMRNKSFGKLYDAAQKFAEAYPDESVETRAQRLVTAFGGHLSPDLAKAIAEAGTDRAAMPIAAADFMENPHGAPADLTEVTVAQDRVSRLETATRQEAVTEPQVLRPLDRGVPGGNEAGYRYHVTTPEALSSIQSGGLETRQLGYGMNMPENMLEPRLFTAPTVDVAMEQASIVEQRVALRMKEDVLSPQIEDTAPTAKVAGSTYQTGRGVETPDIEYLGSDGAWHPLSSGDTAYSDLLEARARLNEAEAAAIDSLKPTVPQLDLPTSNRLPAFLHRVFYQPINGFEKVVKGILSTDAAVKSWSGKLFHADFNTEPALLKLTDKLATDARLIAPQSALGDKSPDATRAYILDNNQTVTNRILARFQVSDADKLAIQTRLANAGSAQEFYDVVSKELFGSSGLIDKYLPKSLSPAIKQRILSISTRDPLAFRGGVPETLADGTTRMTPILSGEVRNGVATPLPFLDNDFINGVRIPSLDDIDIAVNAVKRAAARNKWFGKTYGMAKFSLDLFRLGAKPLVLGAALPAIILHKLIDETLGNVLNPNIVSPTYDRAAQAAYQESPIRVARSMSETTAKTLAGAVDTGAESMTVPVSATKVLSQSETADGAYAGMLDSLDYFRNSQIARYLAMNDLDPVAVEHLMTGGDPALTAFREANIDPVLSRAGATLYDTLGRTADAIRSATFGGHPEFLRYVHSGEFDTGLGVSLPEDTAVARDAQALQTRAATLTERISEENIRTPEGQANLRAMQDELRGVTSKIRDLEDEYGTAVSKGRKLLTMRDRKAMIAQIKSRVADGRITVPDIIMTKKLASDAYFRGNAMDNIREGVGKISEISYRALSTIGRAEGILARGSYFSQRLSQLEADYVRRGFSETDAHAYAWIKAGNETTDMFYDLSTRSTAERASRNIFWFAPVSGELLYRWAYAIPTQSGMMLPGLALDVARVANYIQIGKDLHVLQDVYNPSTQKTELSVAIPGLAPLLNYVTGSHLTGDVNIPVTTIFGHISSPVPQLSPLLSLVMDKGIANRIPAVQGLADVIAPFSDISFVPSAFKSLAAVFGMKVPDTSPDYTNSAWNKTHDQALQYAWTYLTTHGDAEPDPAKFGLVSTPEGGYQGTPAEQKAYDAAYGAWFTRLRSEANRDARGLYGLKFLSSFVIPGQVSYTTEEETAFGKFYTDHIAPKLSPGQPMSDATRLVMQDWLAQHPDSLAFSIFTSKYTGKAVPPSIIDNPTARSNRELYLAGVKTTMDPDSYALVLAGMTSRAQLIGRLNANVARVAGTGSDASQLHNLLTNWGDRKSAIMDYSENWQNYLALHHDVRDVVTTNTDNMEKAYGQASQDVESQYVTQAMGALNQLVKNYETAGVPVDEFKTVMASLKGLQAQLYQQTGGKLTPLETGINHYFDTVISPYMRATQPLYQQAQDITAASGDATSVYNQIAALKAQYTGLKYKGMTLPGPDEFFFGAKTKAEQESTLIHWSSQPIEWLTAWQRQKLGYKSFANEDSFWNQVGAIKDQVTQTGRTDATIKKWEQNQEQRIAASFGQPAVDALALSQQAPAFRITQTQSAFSGNASWQQVMKMVSYSEQRLANDPYGTQTADGLALKQWVYSYIQGAEVSDPEFKKLMQKLMLSTNIQGRNPRGVPLYEAIFFGNFVPQFINPQLSQQFVTSSGVI